MIRTLLSFLKAAGLGYARPNGELGVISLVTALVVGAGGWIYVGSGAEKKFAVTNVITLPAGSQKTGAYTNYSPPRRHADDVDCRTKLRKRGVYPPNADPCIDVDEVIKALDTGLYRFNKPQTAYVEEPFRLVLMLETAAGQDRTGPFQGTRGDIVEKVAPFAQHLQATLHGGTDFKINPADAQVRTVTSSEPIVWEWTVVPLKEGEKTLVIDVSADLILGAAKEHIQLRTLYENIQINVGFFHLFVSAFAGVWEYALGLATMMIAVLGVCHYWPLKDRRVSARPKAKQPPPVELVAHHHHSGSASPPPS